MKIGVVTLQDPWGPSHGGGQRTIALLESLAALGHDVVCVHPAGVRAGHASSKNVIDAGVAGRALGQRAWPPALRAAKRHLLPMPTQTGAMNRGMVASLRELSPLDVLLVSEFPAVSYRRQAPGALLWLDLPDLYSEFARAEVDVRAGVARVTGRWQQRQLAERERRICSKAGIVTVAGWGDSQRLAAAIGRTVTWLPNTFDDVAPLPPPDPPVARVAGLFANFAFLPNVDAAELLARVWAPRLMEAGWRVVVGGHGSETLRLPAHIEVVGAVATPRDFYEQVAMTLAPYRLGRGLKTKVLESLAYGRPVVASAAALEGFPPDFRRCVRQVDLLAPSFGAQAPQLPGRLAEELAPFSRRAFRRAVADLMAGGIAVDA